MDLVVIRDKLSLVSCQQEATTHPEEVMSFSLEGIQALSYR